VKRRGKKFAMHFLAYPCWPIMKPISIGLSIRDAAPSHPYHAIASNASRESPFFKQHHCRRSMLPSPRETRPGAKPADLLASPIIMESITQQC